MSESPDSSETIRLDCPVSLKYLRVFKACLSAMLAQMESTQCKKVVIYNVQIALLEILTNLIMSKNTAHSTVSQFEVLMTLHHREKILEIELFTNGASLDDARRAAGPQSSQEHDQLPTSGNGFLLARTLMDNVQYKRQNQKNYWRLTKRL